MGCLGSRALPPHAELTAQQRIITRAANTTERLRGRCEFELENRMEPALRKAMSQGASPAKQRALARRIAQQQRHIEILLTSETQLHGLAQKIRELASHAQIVEVMHDTTKTLRRLNQKMDLAEVTQMVQTFEVEAARLGFHCDTINEIVAEQSDVDLSDSEDAVIERVLDEAASALTDTLPSIPSLQQHRKKQPKNALEMPLTKR